MIAGGLSTPFGKTASLFMAAKSLCCGAHLHAIADMTFQAA
jgi:hypothetical protein